MPLFIASDSRAFTDYRPRCVVMAELQKLSSTNNQDNQNSFRNFIHTNPEKIKQHQVESVNNQYNRH